MKITPEIEAVARAIYASDLSDMRLWTFDASHDETKLSYYNNAIAAIRALRWPTAGQIEEGEDEFSNVGILPYAYTAMINAALGENK